MKKLLLFDIDGTLMLSGGRGGKLLGRIMKQHLGHEIDARPEDFAGQTDRLIVRNLLTRHDVASDDIETLIDMLIDAYLQGLPAELAPPGAVTVLPGVVQLLATISRRDEYVLGLVTGNLERGARIKLHPPNLNRYFPFGAYGCDAENRDLLPPIAVARATRITGWQFLPENVWIIGDTPNDIRCAAVNGFRCLAVATGHYGADRLRDADAVFPDLADTPAILNVFA